MQVLQMAVEHHLDGAYEAPQELIRQPVDLGLVEFPAQGRVLALRRVLARVVLEGHRSRLHLRSELLGMWGQLEDQLQDVQPLAAQLCELVICEVLEELQRHIIGVVEGHEQLGRVDRWQEQARRLPIQRDADRLRARSLPAGLLPGTEDKVQAHEDDPLAHHLEVDAGDHRGVNPLVLAPLEESEQHLYQLRLEQPDPAGVEVACGSLQLHEIRGKQLGDDLNQT
mmetsp:Transcript_73176/g.211865  ORF Transcript_73176/g.211865 Transcript_73176/m.211865 type:complete len:226 (+) Transcript_73176:487-1164(+)